MSDRFWEKVDASGDCWEWTASRTRDGYGQFKIDQVWNLAHRYVWELLVGGIPKGFQIDHLCRNTGCVNPDHLEPVTPRENTMRGSGFSALNARKTHCIHGHPFDEANTYIAPGSPGRICRECGRRNQRRYKKRLLLEDR